MSKCSQPKSPAGVGSAWRCVARRRQAGDLLYLISRSPRPGRVVHRDGLGGHASIFILVAADRER